MHIRAGMSAQEVAALLGARVEDIARFEGPVLAEREPSCLVEIFGDHFRPRNGPDLFFLVDRRRSCGIEQQEFPPPLPNKFFHKVGLYTEFT